MNTEAVNQEYQTVSLSQLTESLTNPRKTFDHKTLNEMAVASEPRGLPKSNPCVFESANSPMPRRLRHS
jgi:hypothetical protein